jgi:hypothetical protein
MPTLAAQFARLRGLEIAQGAAVAGSLSAASTGGLVAISFATLNQMSASERASFRAALDSGTTLYIRGGVQSGVRYDLAPLFDASLAIGRIESPVSCRVTQDRLIPAVLRGEETPLEGEVTCAFDLSGPIAPILLARDANGAESAVVFACRTGRGVIICDVQPDDESGDTPLIWRLADPDQRHLNLSALIAADRAAGRDVSRAVSFNLTIDDIPLGYDYLNEPKLEEFLGHIEKRCVGVHLDCGWIPTSQRISKRYVDILKSHGAGFVWHGMHRHVDHQNIEHPAAEMEAGKRAMAINRERYGVEFQPMIIFPFERAHRSAEELLLNEGFLAATEQPRHDEGVGSPEYLRYSELSCVHESGFLHRYESAFLTRDRLLAIAALGMPILAFGHPKDVRLRRLSQIVERGGSLSHFDEVLDFASAKGLPGQSLAQIAGEVLH